jgi:AmmeMemoRadiSam system protein B
MTEIRQPAVAGYFYPADAVTLGQTVEQMLGAARATGGDPPKALIVPHAGYIYSGPIAATAYARLAPYRDHYRRVVLLGPCHRVPVRGLALSGADAFRTPLGDIRIDKAAVADLHLAQLQVFDATHQYEHSLEVHLPFLQSVLGDFTLVPIVVGTASHEAVAEVLDALWDGPETLIVISSDLTHYLSYDAARAVDDETRQSIERLDAGRIGHDEACGATPIGGLLETARRRGLEVETLDLRNSGDTAGDRRRVVGYGSWAFFER